MFSVPCCSSVFELFSKTWMHHDAPSIRAIAWYTMAPSTGRAASSRETRGAQLFHERFDSEHLNGYLVSMS
jgi:hypothetical protein